MGSSDRFPAEVISEMFADMRDKYGWDVDAPLIWGYFFIAGPEYNFSSMQKRLASLGYQFVDSWVGSENDGQTWLHVEQTEHHTQDTLMQRNRALSALAEEFPGVTYDGMDVGPIAEPSN